jgi:hypothetical protein
MKNRIRKLTLTREAVRKLADRELGYAHGGIMNTYMEQGGRYCSTQVKNKCQDASVPTYCVDDPC